MAATASKTAISQLTVKVKRCAGDFVHIIIENISPIMLKAPKSKGFYALRLARSFVQKRIL